MSSAADLDWSARYRCEHSPRRFRINSVRFTVNGDRGLVDHRGVVDVPPNAPSLDRRIGVRLAFGAVRSTPDPAPRQCHERDELTCGLEQELTECRSVGRQVRPVLGPTRNDTLAA